MLTSIVKKYFASISIAILTLASLVGIPVKQLANQDNYDPKCVEFGPTIWSKQRAKAYALAYMKVHHPTWTRAEWRSLNKLWGKESAWNMHADNPESSAYGIAQVLNTKPGTPAPLQIEKGLSYIVHRYDRPSIAWAHHRKHNWY
jgi:hypothetical protein